MIGPSFYAANAMVFGSVASTTSWEPFRRAIAALALSYFGSHHLKIKHKEYLDMVRWAEDPEESVVFVPASSCSNNKGVINDDGSEQPSQHNIHVDDNMMADIKRRLIQTLVAVIEAIFRYHGYLKFVVEAMCGSNVQVVEIKCSCYSIFAGFVLEHS